MRSLVRYAHEAQSISAKHLSASFVSAKKGAQSRKTKRRKETKIIPIVDRKGLPVSVCAVPKTSRQSDSLTSRAPGKRDQCHRANRSLQLRYKSIPHLRIGDGNLKKISTESTPSMSDKVSDN
jgi:hypothetical protein